MRPKSLEEGRLLDGLDSVDGAECQTEQTVGVDILAELGRNGSRCLDGLRGSCYASNGDLVGVNLARRTGAITIGDLPGVTTLHLT